MSQPHYLYCVTPQSHRPAASLSGIGDVPVSALAEHGVAIWLSPVAAVPKPTIEHITQHNRVVEGALQQGVTPVPLRFGQVASDIQALRDAIAERAVAWHRQLDEFTECVEFGLHVIAADEAAPLPEPLSGRDYLEALRARARVPSGAQAVLDRLHEQVGTLVRAQRVNPVKSARGIASIAHLVRRTHITDYESGIRSVTQDFTEFRFLHSGPWPPYSFAS
jgi:hypothetical protein